MTPELYFISVLCLWILLSAVVMVSLCMWSSCLSRREEEQSTQPKEAWFMKAMELVDKREEERNADIG